MDYTLPGLQPGFIRLSLERQADGYWEVRVNAAEGQGFLDRSGQQRYQDLTAYEAQDVVTASLEGLLSLI